MAGKRTVGDWIWTLVGVAGVVCIVAAVWMFLAGGRRSPADVAKEQARMAQSHWEKGRARLARGDAKGAVEEFEAAISFVNPHQPVMARLQNDLGKAYEAAGRKGEAGRAFSVAIGMEPTWFEPYLNLGRLVEAENKPGPAYQFYRAAIALHPEPVPEELRTRTETLGASISKPRAEDLEKLYHELRANPANLNALTLLVLARLEETKVEAAAPPVEGLRRALAAVGAGLDKLPDLIEAQRSAVRDRPGSVVDRAGLGVLLLLEGSYGPAREVFAKAVALSGSDPTARLGAALADVLGGVDGEESETTAARVLTKNPVCWLALGVVKLRDGEQEDAKRALGRLHPAIPATPEIYRLLAKAFNGNGEAKLKECALRAYHRLLK